jgi:small subunit ribosomal protein S26
MGAVVHLLFLFCFILFQERAKFYITADNIDRAIEDALASPVDHNYAIDLEGHIYRGHKTKPSDVPPEELEKIQVQEQIS